MKLLWVLIFSISSTISLAQSPEHIRILPETRVWLEGTSTVNEFTCSLFNSSKIDLEVENISNIDQASFHSGYKISISFPVRALDCGKEAMNKDMFDALKSVEFPEIHFELESVNRKQADQVRTDNLELFNVSGILTVAGQPKNIQLEAKAKMPSLGENHKIMGSYKMDMLDFGVTPPTALWGLIKADKIIEIHFEAEIEVQI